MINYEAILADIAEIKISPAETKVALFVLEGLERDDIAAKLYLSPRTVTTHTGNICRKCGVKDRAQLIAKALKTLVTKTLVQVAA
jgi:DNA-binding NarL/FixJ family response regulator